MKRTFMKTAVKTLGVYFIVAMVAGGMILPQLAHSALPAPNWMPGMPMVAGNQLILMWSVVPGAVKYRVYQNGQVVSEVPGIQTIVPAPADPGEYKFYVTAVAADGSESPGSEVKTQNVVRMDPPGDFIARAETDLVSLRWSASSNAVIYDLYKKSTGDADLKLLASVQATQYIDREVKTGETYQYALRAKDATGKQSDLSQSVEASVQAAVAVAGGPKGFKLHPLPSKLVATYSVGGQPLFLDIQGTMGVAVTGGQLFVAQNLPNSQFQVVDKIEGLEKIPEFKGMAFDSDGTLVISARDRILRLEITNAQAVKVLEQIPVMAPGKDPDIKEELLFLFRGKERSFGAQPMVYDVKVASNGDILGSDNSNQRVVKFTSDGEFLGTLGYDPEQNKDPVEIPDWRYLTANFLSMDSDDNLYVSEVFTVSVANPEGERLSVAGAQGNVVGTFGMVTGTVLDKEGRLWAADIKNASVQVFQKTEGDKIDWTPVFVLSNEAGKGNLEVAKPSDIAWGPVAGGKTGLYVVDSIMERISAFEILWDRAEGAQ